MELVTTRLADCLPGIRGSVNARELSHSNVSHYPNDALYHVRIIADGRAHDLFPETLHYVNVDAVHEVTIVWH